MELKSAEISLLSQPQTVRSWTNIWESVIVACFVPKFLPTHLSCLLLDARLKRSFGLNEVQLILLFWNFSSGFSSWVLCSGETFLRW